MINNVGYGGGIDPPQDNNEGVRGLSRPDKGSMPSVPNMEKLVNEVEVPLTYHIDPQDIAGRIRAVLDR